MIVMSRYTNTAVVYAPLYIRSFRLVQPHTLVEAEKFNIRYSDSSQINNTPDRLRWHRYRCGLRQRDVADYAGIDRSTYSSYEEIGRDYYPIENMLESRNMSQREFARRLGVPYGTLQQWEQNRVQMFKRAWKNLMDRG